MDKMGLDELKCEDINNVDGHKVLKLHLELRTNLEADDTDTLRKYGKVQNGISRDLLIPEGMMLHNLHYAIQRVFGWQNGHLHNFSYPENVFKELTKEGFLKWVGLCGLYYRFPDDENEDLFWDDDYDDSMNPKTWLKKKYSAPFIYEGTIEHYMYANSQAKVFVQQNSLLNIEPSFEEFVASIKESKTKKIEDITMMEMKDYFQSSMDELLERLPVSDVIGLRVTEDWTNIVKEIVAKADNSFLDNYKKVKEISRKDLVKLDEIYEITNPKVIPLSDTLVYSYDYGEGWIVDITCTEIYESFDTWNSLSSKEKAKKSTRKEQVLNDHHIVNSQGKEIDGVLREQVAAVEAKKKPLCIEADGLPVMDDVGGISGYCAFLNGIHGKCCGGYPYDDKEESLEWGRAMGWDGRMSAPEKIL